jgi:hypothetical protein
MNEFVVCGFRVEANRGVTIYLGLSFEPQSDLNLNYHILLNCFADTNKVIMLNYREIKTLCP